MTSFRCTWLRRGLTGCLLVVAASSALSAPARRAPPAPLELPAEPLVLGQSIPLSGPGAFLAKPFLSGARLFFDGVNAAGGVNGRRIELVTLDDQGEPAKTAANTRKLLEQGVLALFGYYGSPQVTAAYPIIQNTDVVLFGPMSAADEFGGPRYPNIYLLRPGYAEEAAAITRHAETLGARRLAVLHASDAESLAALDAAERTMTGLGADLVAKVELHARGNAARVAQAVAARPESVLVIGDPTTAAMAVRELRSKSYRGPIYGFSNTGESLLAEQLGRAGAGVVVARVVPKSDSSKLPVVRRLQADAAHMQQGKPNVYMLEGYLAAWALTDALQCAGPAVNRQRLKKCIDGMDDADFGGFRVRFGGVRVGSRVVELSLIDSWGRVRE